MIDAKNLIDAGRLASGRINRVTLSISIDIHNLIVQMFQRHQADDQAVARGEHVENPTFKPT